MNDGFFLQTRQRKLQDTTRVSTEQEIAEYTGGDASGPSQGSAISFYMSHDHPDWHEQAVCRGVSQDVFYGSEDRGGKSLHHPNLTVSEVQHARRYCNRCPVQMQCLRAAIVSREEFGIWGGSTGNQRRKWIKAYEAEISAAVVYEEHDVTYEEYGELEGEAEFDQYIQHEQLEKC